MEALNTQLLQFFDWLLWASIQGSVLIGLIVLVQLILRRKLPIRWHYLIWLLLLIRLAMPWLPESKISIFNLVPQTVRQGRIIESITESDEDFGLYPGMRYTAAEETQPEGDSNTVFVRFVRMVPLLWLVGVVVMAGYVCIRNISLWLTVKRERPITDQKILDLLEDCKMQMGIQTILGVIVSDKIKSPALFGFVRPRLLLAQGMLEAYSLEELRYVFIHELAHLKQRDIYLGWLMALLQVGHWFNPLMWFAFGRMRADRELACDTLAISMMDEDEPSRYGQTIVNLLENFSQVRYLPSVAGILEDTCQIERRIEMITKFKKTSRTQWAGAMLLVVVLACIVLTNAYVAKADLDFGTPTNLGPVVNTYEVDMWPSTTTDNLELYFASYRSDGYGNCDIWVTTRESTQDPWGEPVNLGPAINSSGFEGDPWPSADGLTLYYGSDTTGLMVTRRATKSDNWGPPMALGPDINNGSADWVFPSISRDGLQLYLSEYSGSAPGGFGQSDLWISTRPTVGDAWGPPQNLGPIVNSSAHDRYPCISPDGLSLFFNSNRPGGYGAHDLWVTRRRAEDGGWDPPVNLGPLVNTSSHEAGPSISTDGRILYFSSTRPGGYGKSDLYQVPIYPIVDFNADGIVDSADVCMMLDYWHTDEPLYDIAPLPYGDGIVDVKDLVLLAEHLTIEVDDPNLP